MNPLNVLIATKVGVHQRSSSGVQNTSCFNVLQTTKPSNGGFTILKLDKLKFFSNMISKPDLKITCLIVV